MSPDPTESALAAHLRRRSSRLPVPLDDEILGRVVARSGRLGRRRRARQAAVASVAAVAVAVGGVLVLSDEAPSRDTGDPARTSEDRGPVADQPTGPEPGPQVTAAPQLPFDRVGPGDDQIATRAQAEDQLIAACLADAGFGDRPYPSLLPEAPDTPVPDPTIRDDFGVFDEAEVREDGYRPQRWTMEAERYGRLAAGTAGPTLTEQYGADLLAAWAACQGIASERLRGGPQDMASPEHPVNAVGELRGEAWRAAGDDDRIAAVIAAWSTCLAGRGYDYAHPLDPVRAFAPGDPATGYPPPPPGEEELATGLADVACKAEVSFAPTWYAVLAEHEQAVIDAHPDEIQAATQWHEDVYARSLAVLAGEAPAP